MKKFRIFLKKEGGGNKMTYCVGKAYITIVDKSSWNQISGFIGGFEED